MQIKVFLHNFNTKTSMWGIKFLCLVQGKFHMNLMPCIEYYGVYAPKSIWRIDLG